MTTSSGNVTHFTSVDTASNTSWFISFMDVANALPEYQAIRQDLARSCGDLHGKHILDIGCGTGDDARELAKWVGNQGKVVGIDLSKAMIEEAQQRNTNTPELPIEFLIGDMQKLPFADETFDVVRAKLVRQHCTDIDTVDNELVRVTRSGGRLTIFDYDFDTLMVDHPDKTTTRAIIHAFTDGHQNGWNGRELQRRFLVRGVHDISLTPHTVIMPFTFFTLALEGRLRSEQASGNLPLSLEELAAWWQPLQEAAIQGRFFAAMTGLRLNGTRA